MPFSDIPSSEVYRLLDRTMLQLSKTLDEVISLKKNKAELEAKVAELTRLLIVQRKEENVNQDQDILMAIKGSWNIDASNEGEEKSSLHFEFDSDLGKLKIQETKDSVKVSEDEAILGKFYSAVDGEEVIFCTKEVVFCTKVEENALVTTKYEGRRVSEKVERFVKDGKLHVITKRVGFGTKRIYTKDVPQQQKEDNLTNANRKIEFLEMKEKYSKDLVTRLQSQIKQLKENVKYYHGREDKTRELKWNLHNMKQEVRMLEEKVQKYRNKGNKWHGAAAAPHAHASVFKLSDIVKIPGESVAFRLTSW